MTNEPTTGAGERIAYAPPDNTQNEWLKAYLAMDPEAVRRAALWLGAWRAAGLYVDPRNTDRARIRFAWTADVDDGEATNIRELPANGPGFYRGYGHLHVANIGRRLRFYAKLDRQWRPPPPRSRAPSSSRENNSGRDHRGHAPPCLGAAGL